VVTLLFAALLLHGARLTLSAWVTVWRMHDQGGHGVWNQAVRGLSVLRRFRWVFVTLWGLATTLVFGALAFNGLCVVQSFAPYSSRPELRLVELSAGYVALALGRPLSDPAVATAVRIGWLLYGLSGPALLAVSVGQLARRRRRERRRLREAPADAELLRAVERLATRGEKSVRIDTSRVRAVVPQTSAVVASSDVYGLRRPERFIVVSSGGLEALERDELEAVVAHELVHLLDGHCRRDQLLRWLGRLTFVGDGFALLMQNSWGYEEAADRTAIEKLGVPRETLVRCLQKMRHSKAIARLAPLDPTRFSGLPALSDYRDEIKDLLEKGPAALPFRRRWSLAWQILHKQYFDAIGLYYWHPTDRIREQILRSL
jgi:Zn-dependent protease with chaperone function